MCLKFTLQLRLQDGCGQRTSRTLLVAVQPLGTALGRFLEVSVLTTRPGTPRGIHSEE